MNYIHGKYAVSWIKRTYWDIIERIKTALRYSAIIAAFGWAVVGGYFLNEFDGQREMVAYAATLPGIEIKGKTVEQLKNDVVNEIEACESGGKEGLVVFDQNKAQTLKGSNIASIGVMQWKVPTIQHYIKQLHHENISDKDAILLALDSERAKALAKEVIFTSKGGLFNWACYTEKMKIKVELIKEME